MTLSGPGETWLDGDWAAGFLAVTSWKVWTWESGALESYDSTVDSWGDVPDLVLAVVAYHANDRMTTMLGVDGYPEPGNPASAKKNGVQIEAVDSSEWLTVAAQIYSEM